MSSNKRYITGFTLTELMIVIAIIGILGAIVIMSFNQQLFKGNDSKRKADLNTIKIALEEYEKDHNCYPTTINMAKCGSDVSIAIHPYLKDVPCDPVTRQPYAYEAGGSSCPDWFRLFSLLQNTKDAAVLPYIGPNSAYNFYMSSDNAPAPVAGGGETPGPSSLPGGCSEGNKRYGCIGGVCQEVQLDETCNPVCDPAYETTNCNGQCVPNNPASECVSI